MQYQVGGSLSFEAASYVERQADRKLYKALKQGEFCYILNSRQIGKSSLLIRIRHRLEQEGFKCVTLDMTNIGSKNITPQQWYGSIIADLCLGFGLIEKINLKAWWQQWENCSLTFILNLFIEQLLYVHFPRERLVIFIDEIDNLLNLNFPTDDFFGLIRFCYNQRAINPEYQRLTFAVFGVAIPSDLILNRNISPFNIGQSIEINDFEQQESLLLTQGLKVTDTQAQAILKEILFWTSGQPFLTQKICDLVASFVQNTTKHLPDSSLIADANFVSNLIKKYIIENWEFQDEPQHLRSICERIEHSGQHKDKILNIYQQILQGLPVKSDDSREQKELLLIGIVVIQKGLLKVKNQIYAEIFNLNWVEEQRTKNSRVSTLRRYISSGGRI